MGRALEKLTAIQVQRIAKQPGVHGDGGGLYLSVHSKTARSWVFRYMLDNKAREMGLGPYPTISLARAREKAAEARRLKAEGIDPLKARDAARSTERLEAAQAITFRVAAKKYIAAKSPGWGEVHAQLWQQSLEDYAMPEIGDLAVQAITTGMVKRVLEPIWSSKPVMASRLRGRIESVLDWAATLSYRTGENPARWKGHLEHVFPSVSEVHTVKHHPALPYADVAAFVASAAQEPGVGSAALRFTILTAARSGEVLGAMWPEIDLEKAIWTIPAERMKAGREHQVPLSKQALAILQAQHEATGGRGFVFPGAKRGKPLSQEAMPLILRRLRQGITVHGFRSTFRDWAGETTAYPREVIEHALAHQLKDKAEAAYARGTLLEKRRKLMDAWAEYCGMSSADRGGNVVSIGGVAAAG